jgi:GrpB-like predicted nucleotidyltransferase (UPF0157 family)
VREIEIVSYNPNWPTIFEQEAKILKKIFGALAIKIHHKGSTSVPNLMAKPIIDITIEVEDIAKVNQLNGDLSLIGYNAQGELGMPLRRFFTKGDPRSHHLHVWDKDHDEVLKDLIFRDTLIQNLPTRSNYEKLKLQLAEQYRFEPDNYTMGKDGLIKEILHTANYNGISMVFVLMDCEKQAYKHFMDQEPIQNKSIVVSMGVNFIGAISLNDKGEIERKIITKANEQAEKLINRWLETRILPAH